MGRHRLRGGCCPSSTAVRPLGELRVPQDASSDPGCRAGAIACKALGWTPVTFPIYGADRPSVREPEREPAVFPQCDATWLLGCTPTSRPEQAGRTECPLPRPSTLLCVDPHCAWDRPALR